MSTLNNEKSDNDSEMSCLSTPSKVALSLAQNPMRSITPGYMETDIKFLIESTSSTVSPDEEQVHFEFPQSVDRKREIYRQIAVAYAMMTLYLFPPRKLTIGDSTMELQGHYFRLLKDITI
jgi:hypothetical protein